MTMPFIDHSLSDREKTLVWRANQDPVNKPDGVFRIDRDTIQCDVCGARIPHNGKGGDDSVTDFYITRDEGVLCSLCADEAPETLERDDETPGDVAPGRGNQ